MAKQTRGSIACLFSHSFSYKAEIAHLSSDSYHACNAIFIRDAAPKKKMTDRLYTQSYSLSQANGKRLRREKTNEKELLYK